MSWIVDHAGLLYVILGIAAAGFVVGWWFDKRVKFLGFAAGVLALMGLVWLLTQLVATDRTQLKQTVEAMARDVVDGKMDDLFKHIAPDFNYKGMNRDMLHRLAQNSVKGYKINNITIAKFDADVAPNRKTAKTSFNVTPFSDTGDYLGIFRTEADFVREGEEWKLKTLRFYNAVVDQDKEIDLPFFR
jgi:hypothetical protein